MKRREFISLLGGAAAWPFAASAQQRCRWNYRHGFYTAEAIAERRAKIIRDIRNENGAMSFTWNSALSQKRSAWSAVHT